MNEPQKAQPKIRIHDLPGQNVRCFKLMYAIENGIRELIIETLANFDGRLWYKHRLPADVLEKYREGIELQRRTKWINLIPHHPIYYVDFPDLRKIIERQDNWKDAFSTIFARKDLISATLAELEPARNALAHNRKLAAGDLIILEAAWSKLVSAVGAQRFRQLASLTSTASTIRETLANLRSELTSHLYICTNCQELKSMRAWDLISQQWWFDETYLGRSTDPLKKCFNLFTQYSKLPRHRGSGHILEKWVKNSKLPELASSALESLGELIDSTN
jgi:hypothetical protein